MSCAVSVCEWRRAAGKSNNQKGSRKIKQSTSHEYHFPIPLVSVIKTLLTTGACSYTSWFSGCNCIGKAVAYSWTTHPLSLSSSDRDDPSHTDLLWGRKGLPDGDDHTHARISCGRKGLPDGDDHRPVTWLDARRGTPPARWAWLRAAPGVEGACSEWLCWGCLRDAFPAAEGGEGPALPAAIRCPECARAPCTLFVVEQWGAPCW